MENNACTIIRPDHRVEQEIHLHPWKKRQDPACPLCDNNQSLLHVLNNCPVTRELRRYNVRHDVVLKEIAAAIQPYLSPSSVLSIDIHDTYEFSLHIVGSRYYESFAKLATVLHMPARDLMNLLRNVTRATITGSFTIWCSRNRLS